MKRLVLLSLAAFLCPFLSRTQALSPYTTCPNVNVAVVRAGTNSDITNPYFLYDVNQSTGAMTLTPGGPFKDPANPALNLQVNAVGLSKKDGFLYGLVFDGTITTARFVRLDKNYGVTVLGTIPSPISGTGLIGFINSAAGEVDTAGNYYFTAGTINPLPTPTLDKFYLGKISNIGSLTGSSVPLPTYFEIDVTGANCASYISTFTSDPNNSGLKDFSYNAFTNSFFTYATYKPAGATNFSGQVLELKAIAGSSPLRYQLICNATVNTHTAETSGTIIDKFGGFTVLFTDGSFGVANRGTTTTYSGTYTQLATSSGTGLPNPLRGDMASCGQQTFPGPPSTPLTTCPNANYGVIRQGFNADINNPYNIYSLNTTTGAFTIVPGGPLVYPDEPSRTLQVNGVGINGADGFFYGLTFEGTVNTSRLVRFDINYGVAVLGPIAPPTSATGLLSFVNSAAGTNDGMNNYYFSGFTANPAFTPSLISLDKLFLGKIANVSTAGAAIAPQYFEIDYSDAACSNYIASLSADPNNSGLKDFAYSPVTGTFYSYVTYKPTGSLVFLGQMVELREIQGSSPLRYKLFCTPVINTHTAETAGVLIDNAGNFEVLMTDGTIGKIQSVGTATNYTGLYVPLNNATGLPSVIRADLASCPQSAGGIPLPVHLLSFSGSQKDCHNYFEWTVEDEVGFSHYELEENSNSGGYKTVVRIPANGGSNRKTYTANKPAPGSTSTYRLKLVDKDGRFTYSSIIPVRNSCSDKAARLVISPNPVRSNITLNWYGISDAKRVDIQLYNSTGTVFKRLSKVIAAGTSVMTIDTDGLPSGVYYIKATDGNTEVVGLSKFVKQ